MNTPPPRPPAFRRQLKALRRQPRSCRSFSPPSDDRREPQFSVKSDDGDPPPFDIRGIVGIPEAADPASRGFDAISEAVAPAFEAVDSAPGADELPRCGDEADAAPGLADTAVLPVVRFQEPKGRAEKRADDAEIQEAAKRRSFASLALASGTGEDVAALMGGTGGRRWRLNRDNARAVLIAVAVCLVAAWAWLALTKPGGDESQSKLVEERGSSASRGVGRGKASDSAKGVETGKKPSQESRGGGESGGGSTGGSTGPSSIVVYETGKKPFQESRGGGESSGGSTGPSSIVVYVSGAVKTPGVYTLAPGSRVDDAVRAAGGLSERAESAGTNLAAQLSDGEHVHVAAAGESAPSGALGPSSGSESAGGEKGSGAKSSGKGAGKKTAPGQKAGAAKVNVNTAGAEELQTLPGVGPATAKAIVAWREENGRFRSVDDLLDVSGIGKATLAKFRDRVSV